MKTFPAITRLLILLTLSSPALADSLRLDEKSVIRFISVKNAAVAEVHEFRKLSGQVDGAGRVEVSMPLVDVETWIPIRNERMQKLFFETERFPRATIAANIDMAALGKLKNGAYETMELSFRLDLHGNKKQFQAPVTVARLGAEIHVNTVRPLVLNVADFELTPGVERLREIAGLRNISTAVPVTASLVFTR